MNKLYEVLNKEKVRSFEVNAEISFFARNEGEKS